MLQSRKIRASLCLLACALPLTGCAAPAFKPTVIHVERMVPPPFLLTCSPDPDVPEAADQSAVASYLVDVWAAGESCRSRLAAVLAWSREDVP